MAARADEEHFLSEFLASGSRDSLRALLLAHQDRVYNICYQVLGRREDAEDAAQVSLLQLAEGARVSADAAGLRRWTYRVSLRAALDVWRRRESIRRIETRSAMSRPAAVPFEDPERRALIEAMDRLTDGERELIVEHYFEKTSLEELAARQGLSAVAIWKRIDKAREKLKKLLLGAGFAAASTRCVDALEASVPAAAPDSLVGEALIGKILAGGLAVAATKTSFWAVTVIAAALALVLGAGSYRMIGSLATSNPSPVHAGGSAGETQSPGTPAPSPMAVALPTESEPPMTLKENRALLERLAQYKELHDAWMTEVRAGRPDSIHFNDKGLALMKEAQHLILEDPDTFLDFLCDPANEEMCRPLIYHALDRRERWNFKDLPAALTDGFLKILKSGRASVKAELLGWLRLVNDPSELFDEQYGYCLNDPDPMVQAGAMVALWRNRTLDAVNLQKAQTLFEAALDPRPKIAAVDAISQTHSPEVARWIGEQLNSNRRPDLVQALARAAYRRLDILLSTKETPDPRELDQFAVALTSAARVQTDWFGLSMVVGAALRLPADRSIPVLEEAIKNAHTAKEKAAAESVLAKVRAGGFSAAELTKEFKSLSSPR